MTTHQILSTNMEREIQAEVRRRPPLGDRRLGGSASSAGQPAPAMPDYVEHRPGVTEIGKLSAEAVVREYEAAAKEIELMGAELVERVKQCEAMTADALAVSEELKEVASRYRREAKRVFDQIENCSFVVAEARKVCTELRDQIATPTAIERQRKK